MAATWRLFYAGDPGDDLYCEPQRFGLTDKDCDRLARWYAESSDGDTINLCDVHKEQVRAEGLAR